MLSRDTVSGLTCLSVSLVLLVFTFGLPPASMVPIGPAFYPRIVLGLTAFLSIALIITDVHIARRSTPAADSVVGSRPSTNYRLVVVTFVLFGLYIGALPSLGFRIATFAFVLALQVALERPETATKWLLAVGVAVATTLICYLVFEDYLSVLLPRGTWSGL